MHQKSILTSTEIFERTARASDQLRRDRLTAARTDFVEFSSIMTDDELAAIPDRKLFFKISRAMWEVGRNPSLRVFLHVKEQRQGVQQLLEQVMVASVGAYSLVFPNVPVVSVLGKPITVKRPRILKDPSIQVIDDQSTLLGSRVDLILCDDPGDVTNNMRGRLTAKRARSTETL